MTMKIDAPKKTLAPMILVSFLSLIGLVRGAAASAADTCRSNATHIAWPCPCDEETTDVATSWTTTAITSADHRRRAVQSVERCSCQIQTLREAQVDAYKYLRSHVMEFDVPFLGTLGFDDDDSDRNSTDDLPDGLGGGMIGPTIEHALQAKVLYPYTDLLPKHIWREYVLNHANANEARSNWRPLLHKKLSGLVPNNGTDLPAAVLSLNRDLWTVLAPGGTADNKIVFVGSQTPLIFDPMSVLVFGYASCTGLAILFVSALRSVGIPSRLVGTPAWHQDRNSGNHNWLEVYHDGVWKFMEPTAVKDPQWIDGVDVDPCRRWFCDKSHFTDDVATTTKVYAARLERPTPTSYYPLAWEWGSTAVPGEDVSESYQRVCSKCP